MFYSYSSRGRGFASSPDVFARRSPSRQQTVGEQQVDEPGRAHSSGLAEIDCRDLYKNS